MKGCCVFDETNTCLGLFYFLYFQTIQFSHCNMYISKSTTTLLHLNDQTSFFTHFSTTWFFVVIHIHIFRRIQNLLSIRGLLSIDLIEVCRKFCTPVDPVDWNFANKKKEIFNWTFLFAYYRFRKEKIKKKITMYALMVNVQLNDHHGEFGISERHSFLQVHQILVMALSMFQSQIARILRDRLDRNYVMLARTIGSGIEWKWN